MGFMTNPRLASNETHQRVRVYIHAGPSVRSLSIERMSHHGIGPDGKTVDTTAVNHYAVRELVEDERRDAVFPLEAGHDVYELIAAAAKAVAEVDS